MRRFSAAIAHELAEDVGDAALDAARTGRGRCSRTTAPSARPSASIGDDEQVPGAGQERGQERVALRVEALDRQQVLAPPRRAR